MLNPSSSAASRCVIPFFLAFFNVTSRSRSACVMSSCPSCIPKAWGCQEDISTLLKGDIIILPPHSGTVHSGTVHFRDLIDGLTMEERVDEVTGMSQLVVTDSPDEKRQPTIIMRPEGSGAASR